MSLNAQDEQGATGSLASESQHNRASGSRQQVLGTEGTPSSDSTHLRQPTATARVAPEPRQRQRSASSARRHSTGSLVVGSSTTRARRRSSLIQDFKAAVQDVLSDAEDTTEGTIDAEETNESASAATNKDEELGGVDIPAHFKALVKQVCDGRLTDTAAVEGPVAAWRLKHFRGIDNPCMLALFNDALPDVLARLAELENKRRGAEKRTVFWTVALTFCGTILDCASCYVLIDAGSTCGIPMLVVLLSSMAMQARPLGVFSLAFWGASKKNDGDGGPVGR